MPTTNTPDDFVYAHACQIGKQVAQRCGLCGEEAEDCACGSVARIWKVLHSERGQAIALLPERELDAWIACCAWHDALNFCRHLALQQDKEFSMNSLPGEEPAALPQRQAPGPTPEDQVLRKAFRKRVAVALRKLSPLLRDALVACELQEASLREYADSRHCTLKAAEQRLMRARKRLRQALEDQGDTETVLRDYLSPI